MLDFFKDFDVNVFDVFCGVNFGVCNVVVGVEYVRIFECLYDFCM